MPPSEIDSLHGCGATVSEQVLTAIAKREEVHPLDFDTRLYDVIDRDARNRYFQSKGMDGQIESTYIGSEVAVFSDGRITSQLHQ